MADHREEKHSIGQWKSLGGNVETATWDVRVLFSHPVACSHSCAYGRCCSSHPPSGRGAAATSPVAAVGKQLLPCPGKENGLMPMPHRQPGPILLGVWDREEKQKKCHKVKQHHCQGQSHLPPLLSGESCLSPRLSFPFDHFCCSYANDQ